MEATSQGVRKMCPRCGRLTKQEFFVGFGCIRCDTIRGDAEVEEALSRFG